MVYLLLVEGFEEIEAVYPLDVLRRCGAEVKTVGGSDGFVTGSHGIKIEADICIDEINFDDLGNNTQMLIIPGGPGRVHLKEERVMSLIKRCFELDIPVAAICGAPEILGEAGLLEGRKATCFPGLESKLKGADFVDGSVVIDGNLITSKGAGCSEAFSFAIAEFLCGKEKAADIFKKMVCPKK